MGNGPREHDIDYSAVPEGQGGTEYTIINETINKNNLIDGKLAAQLAAANCPEMQELAGVLKTEITASLDAVMTPIIESIVGRFLQARRTPLGSRPFALDDTSAAIRSARNAILGK